MKLELWLLSFIKLVRKKNERHQNQLGGGVVLLNGKIFGVNLWRYGMLLLLHHFVTLMEK